MKANWKIIQLKTLGHTFGGLTNKNKDDFGDGKPYIPYLNIFQNAKINPHFIEYVKITPNERQNKVQFGDLFFTTSSETPEEVGMTSILLNELEDTYLNSFCFGFRLNNFDDLLPNFAVYLFRWEYIRKIISDLAQGSTRYNLSKSILFDKLYLPLPPLPTQRRIAHILSTCDKVIEQTEAAISKYEAIKEGLMQDLFTRGIDMQTGQLRASYEQAPELYKETELGWVPKEWEVKRLGEVINAIDPQPDHRTPAEYQDGVPYLGINDIDAYGNVNYQKCRKVSTSVLKEQENRYEIKNGDIIFGKIGTIGQPKRLINFKKLTLSANVILIQPQNNPSFIFWLLNSDIINQQITNLIHTTSQPAFGMEKIRNLYIPFPKDMEQNAISSKMEGIINKLTTERSTLAKYRQLKAGLMADLLGGRVEV